MVGLRDAVVRTFAYAAVFGSGVRMSELSRFLFTEKDVPFHDLVRVCESLIRERKITRRSVSSHNDIWRSAYRLQKTVAWIPWIQSVWVTGSAAVFRNTKDDDIDFMIVTDPNRLWLSRLLLVVLGLLQGNVRTLFGSPHQSWAGHWCLNLWLEPNAFTLGSERKNVYVAREIIQAVPLYRRADVRMEHFLSRNRWVEAFVWGGWHFAWQRAKATLSAQTHMLFLRNSLFQPVFHVLNDLAWEMQIRRIHTHQTRERISKDRAFFHPRDTQGRVHVKYERICAALGVLPWPNAPKHWNDTPSPPTGPKRKSRNGLKSGSTFALPKKISVV